MNDSSFVTVEGRWAVEALIDSEAFAIREIVVECGRHLDLCERLDRLAIPYRESSREELEKDTGFAFHRGVYAVAARPELRGPEKAFLTSASCLVVPWRLADPGNLGTVIRSAAAFGCDGVVVEAGKGADVYGRKAIRASARAIFQLPLFEVDDLSLFLKQVREETFTVFGTSLGAKARALDEIDPPEKSVILLGTEADGLPPELEEQCDEKIRIPMQGGMDSLNVAACAAIVLYEFSRSRGNGSVPDRSVPDRSVPDRSVADCQDQA